MENGPLYENALLCLPHRNMDSVHGVPQAQKKIKMSQRAGQAGGKFWARLTHKSDIADRQSPLCMFKFCFASGSPPTCTATSSTAIVTAGNTTLTSAARGKFLAGLTIRAILQIKVHFVCLNSVLFQD